MIAGGIGEGAAFAAGGGAPVTDSRPAPAGFYACVANGNKIANATYPANFGTGDLSGIPLGWAVKVATSDTASVRAGVLCAAMG